MNEMEDLIKQLNVLLQSFNNSFSLDPKLIEQDGQQIVQNLIIKDLKNDGSEFIQTLIEMLSVILSTTDDYELVVDENDGLNIAKKVTITSTLLACASRRLRKLKFLCVLQKSSTYTILSESETSSFSILPNFERTGSILSTCFFIMDLKI